MRGIQEVDGVDIARPVTVSSKLMEKAVSQRRLTSGARQAAQDARGRYLFEIPLDIQGRAGGA